MISNSINRLKILLENIPFELSKISEDEFSMKSNPIKWSKKQILGHLIDSAANNHHRIIRVQYENIPTLFYDQNKWNELNYYQYIESKNIIQFWIIYNQHILEIIKHIPENSFLKECDIGNNKNVTLKFIIEDYILHMEHHLKQIVTFTF